MKLVISVFSNDTLFYVHDAGNTSRVVESLFGSVKLLFAFSISKVSSLEVVQVWNYIYTIL